MICCVCGAPMRSKMTDWCFRCASCGTWASDLPIGINTGEVHAVLDEDLREQGLAELRRHNLAVVAERLVELGVGRGGRVLDVGSAHGWFLQAASGQGLDAEGIEPDAAVARRSAMGDKVRVGFFPDALRPGETFDAITYNDVLEHIPDLDAAVAASCRHLAPGGLLSINIPNSRGLFFRLAVVCHVLGLTAAFERLWQVGLPSPHRWYFDRSGLIRLGDRHHLDLVSSRSLDSVRRRGLWQRAHADRRPTPSSVLGVGVVWLLAPIFNASGASDILHLVFRKTAEDETAAA